MNQPLVSICVPTYNNAKYLHECLDSIASQTYKNIEVIIGDDGSTDDTVSIAREYVKNHDFKIHRNETNMGAGATSTTLVNMAHGEYIAVYHSDDVYEKSIVEESVAVLAEDEQIGIVGTMSNIIDEEGRYLGEFRLHNALKNLKKRSYAFDEVMLGVLKNGGHDIILVTPSVMSRAKIYRELGGFNADKYRSIYDYEMWLRIAKRYNVAVIEKNLMNYRIHKNQISAQDRTSIDVQNIVWVIRDYRQYIKDNKLRRYCDGLLDRWIFRTAKRQNYRRYYEKSNETLKLIRSRKYLPVQLLLRVMNSMQISLKRRST